MAGAVDTVGSLGGGRGVAGNADESTPSSERLIVSRSFYQQDTGRCEAQLYFDSKRSRLGTFGAEEEAARTVDRMSRWCKNHGNMRQGEKAFTYNF